MGCSSSKKPKQSYCLIKNGPIVDRFEREDSKNEFESDKSVELNYESFHKRKINNNNAVDFKGEIKKKINNNDYYEYLIIKKLIK